MYIDQDVAAKMRQDDATRKTIMRKKPSDVVMIQMDTDFTVQTNEGDMTGKPGDCLAYDEKSGHIWPVAASYVEMHYEAVEATDAG